MHRGITGNGTRRSKAGLVAAGEQGAPGTSDPIWITLAKEIPGGVGGIFIDAGVGYLWLVDPSKRTEAIAALAAIPLGIGIQQFGFPLQNAVVLKARWDFAQLADWFAYLTPRALPGLQ